MMHLSLPCSGFCAKKWYRASFKVYNAATRLVSMMERSGLVGMSLPISLYVSDDFRMHQIVLHIQSSANIGSAPLIPAFATTISRLFDGD